MEKAFRYLQKAPLLIFIPVLLLIFCILSGFNGLYGQDSFEYLRYSRAVHNYLSGNNDLPCIFYWPVLYPLSGALLSFLLTDFRALQVISILCFGATAGFLQKILFHLHPIRKKEMTACLFLFFILSPFVLRYSLVVMSDMMAMLFVTAFLYFYLLFDEKGNNRHFVWLVFFGAAAINTRYASAIILIIPGLQALYRFFRKFNLLTLIVALLIAAFISLPGFVLKTYGAFPLKDTILIPDWSVMNFFKNSFYSPDGHQTYTFSNIFFVFSALFNPGYIFPGLLFFIFIPLSILKKPFFVKIILILAVYSLFLAGFTTQNSRFLLLTFPCVIILYSGSFLKICDITVKINKIIPAIFIVTVFIVQSLLFYRGFRPFYINNKIVKEVAEKMEAYPGKTIYTFDIDQGLKEYGIKNEIINMWPESIIEFRPGSLVLFNYANSYHQWKNTNPVRNFERVRNRMFLVKNLPGNWNLYEIRK